MITEKRVRELREFAANIHLGEISNSNGVFKFSEVIELCDLALRALEGEKREVPRFRFHWEFKGDKVELTTPVDPAGQSCLFSDVAALRSSPVDRAQGDCDTCKGFKVINIDDWHQQPCPDCAPAAAVAIPFKLPLRAELTKDECAWQVVDAGDYIVCETNKLNASAIVSLCNASQGSVRVPREMTEKERHALYEGAAALSRRVYSKDRVRDLEDAQILCDLANCSNTALGVP